MLTDKSNKQFRFWTDLILMNLKLIYYYSPEKSLIDSKRGHNMEAFKMLIDLIEWLLIVRTIASELCVESLPRTTQNIN